MPSQTHNSKVNTTEAPMHVGSTGTAAEMPAQLPSTVDTVPPVLNATTLTIANTQKTISIGQQTPQ